MAAAREEEKHFKKTADRRDFNTKRKNSFVGKNKELHTATPPAAGTATPSPTTPTSAGSTSSNASFASGPGPVLPNLRPVQEHIPVNNFNAQEVSAFLNNSWKEAMDRLHDSNVPDSEKPEKYTPTEKAWGNKGGLVWGQRGRMANGNDFFTELRKSSPTQATNAQPATAK